MRVQFASSFRQEVNGCGDGRECGRDPKRGLYHRVKPAKFRIYRLPLALAAFKYGSEEFHILAHLSGGFLGGSARVVANVFIHGRVRVRICSISKPQWFSAQTAKARMVVRIRSFIEFEGMILL